MNRLFERPLWQLAVAAGILIGISYPPSRLGFLAWIGFIPFIHILLQATPRQAFRLGYLTGITTNLLALYWIGFNSGAGFLPVFASLVAAVLYLGVWWSLLAAGLSWFHRRSGKGLMLFPFLWITMEYLRSFGSLGFPWINIALSQVQYLPLIQLAEIGGSYVVGFWVLVMNMGLYVFIHTTSNRRQAAILIAVLFLGVLAGGVLRIKAVDAQPAERRFHVVITQPNFDPNEKWDYDKREFVFRRMDSLLVEALRYKPDLVVWPESAVPAYLRLNSRRRQPYQQKVNQSGIPLLTGTVDLDTQDDERRVYNGSLLMLPGGRMETYHKIQLVPFGEYIPLSGLFPALKKLNLGQGNFDHGHKYTVFEVDSVRFANVICYESSIPRLIRKFVVKGARFLTIETNDAWFGNTAGPVQHFALAVLRAVEFRMPVVRSANTGISGIILPSGVVTGKIPLDNIALLEGNIPIRKGVSFYGRTGDWFALLCGLISLLSTGLLWRA